MVDLENKRLKVRSKIWLELDGVPFMGEGRLTILRAIDRYGSMSRASQNTNIAYRRLRGIIREMEAHLGRALVIVNRGGREGGGATITDSARDLIHRFERFQVGIQESVNGVFEREFKEFVNR